jgi:hypothetical protein
MKAHIPISIYEWIVGKIKAKHKPCKYFYKLFIQIIQQEPVKCHNQIGKWFKNFYSIGTYESAYSHFYL